MPRRREWERDLINRQRNIVFPDTVLNEGRFYRNIFSRKAVFNPLQRFGIFLLGLSYLTAGTWTFTGAAGTLLQPETDVLPVFTVFPILGLIGLTLFGIKLITRSLIQPPPRKPKRLRGYRRPRA